MTMRMSPQSMSLVELIGSHREFRIPPHQRAYSWRETEVERLFADTSTLLRILKSAGNGPTAGTPPRRMFLGTIYLSHDGTLTEIADGQQRMVTASLILAVLRDFETDPAIKARLQTWLVDPTTGIARLRLREPDDAFFAKWVLAAGATVAAYRSETVAGDGLATNDTDDDTHETSTHDLTESQENILKNRDLIAERLKALGADGRAGLRQFLIDRTELVVITAPSLDEARDAHASTHRRGLQLAETDKLKAEIIGDAKRHERVRLGYLWDEAEGRTGKQGLEALCEHLVMIEAERKPNHDIQGDLFRSFKLPQNAVRFVEQSLVPAARAFQQIQQCRLRDPGRLAGARPEGRRIVRINGLLITLARVTHDTWKAAAIVAVQNWSGDPTRLETALRVVERAASTFMLVGLDPNEAIEVYAEAIAAFKRDDPSGGGALELDTALRRRAREVLVMAKFGTKDRCRMPVLMKLNDLIAGDVRGIDPGQASCEHVLPQNPDTRSPWRGLFLQADGRAYNGHNYVQRLGNLVILTFDDNQRADRATYAEKRSILAHSTYALASDAAREKAWNPAVVDARTERLAALLIDHWQL